MSLNISIIAQVKFVFQDVLMKTLKLTAWFFEKKQESLEFEKKYLLCSGHGFGSNWKSSSQNKRHKGKVFPVLSMTLQYSTRFLQHAEETKSSGLVEETCSLSECEESIFCNLSTIEAYQPPCLHSRRCFSVTSSFMS